MFPADKLKHLAVGTLLQIAGGLLHPVFGLAVVALVSWAKEDEDAKRPDKHTADGWDAYATMLGALPGQLLLELARFMGWWP